VKGLFFDGRMSYLKASFAFVHFRAAGLCTVPARMAASPGRYSTLTAKGRCSKRIGVEGKHLQGHLIKDVRFFVFCGANGGALVRDYGPALANFLSRSSFQRRRGPKVSRIVPCCHCRTRPRRSSLRQGNSGTPQMPQSLRPASSLLPHVTRRVQRMVSVVIVTLSFPLFREGWPTIEADSMGDCTTWGCSPEDRTRW